MHGQCELLTCEVKTIFKHAARLLGHGDIGESTVISAKSGQVLYPTVFESNAFIRGGILHLSAFTGNLVMDQMCFESLLDAFSASLHEAAGSEYESSEVDSESDLRAAVASNSVNAGVGEPEEVNTPAEDAGISQDQ